MQNFMLILLFPLISFAATVEKFGQPITLKDPVSLEKAIEQMANSKPQLVEAKVEKVCQKKGCFMELKSAKGDVRVRFKDYSFFVPFTLGGKTVLVEGTLSEKKLTLEEAKHYAKDMGVDPNSVKEGRSEYQIIATGVAVKN